MDYLVAYIAYRDVIKYNTMVVKASSVEEVAVRCRKIIPSIGDDVYRIVSVSLIGADALMTKEEPFFK